MERDALAFKFDFVLLAIAVLTRAEDHGRRARWFLYHPDRSAIMTPPKRSTSFLSSPDQKPDRGKDGHDHGKPQQPIRLPDRLGAKSFTFNVFFLP